MRHAAVCSFKYAVFTFAVDDAGAIRVPIGVVLWSPEREWYRFRFVKNNEKLSRFRPQEHFPFVELMGDKLESWATAKKLPYAPESFLPHQTEWWQQVKELLIHRIQLSEPRPIDCTEPETELEPLFESIVGPYRSQRTQRNRVNGEIGRCLNGLSRKFHSKKSVPGFGNRPVQVMRSFDGAKGWVVIEGVNLAAAEAEKETDAVVSRLERVKEGIQQKRCELMVGYLTSPDGLNGERVLVEWIQHRTGAQTFDLSRQRKEFRKVAGDLVAELAMPQSE